MTQKSPAIQKQEQPKSTKEKDNSAALVSPQAKTAKPHPMAIVKNETNGKKNEQDFPRLWNNSKSESRLHLMQRSPPPPQEKPVNEPSKVVSPRNMVRPVKSP